jgi:ComF family protein
LVAELVAEEVSEGFFERHQHQDLHEDLHEDLHAVAFIPIHAARRRERGYNQAELIARGVADALGLPLLDVMRRTRYTGTQTALSEQQRLVNLQNAFIVHSPDLIRNARILLIDDVLTTGATLNTAAEALLMAGARRVDALTIAATV